MLLGSYRGDSALSPHHQLKSHSQSKATRMKMNELAQDVENAVEEDFTLHYRVTDTEQFLNKLLPVEQETLDTILERRTLRFYNSEMGRFPRRHESRKRVKEEEGEGEEEGETQGEGALWPVLCNCRSDTWIRRKATSNRLADGRYEVSGLHTMLPQSEDDQGARLRPDALLALRVISDQTVLKECQEGEQEGGQEEEGLEEVQGEKDAEEEEAEEEEESMKGNTEKRQQEKAKARDNMLPLIWWLQVIAAVEMKPTDSNNWVEVVKQLIGYLRRILREQLDRRFVFGFTLGPRQSTHFCFYVSPMFQHNRLVSDKSFAYI